MEAGYLSTGFLAFYQEQGCPGEPDPEQRKQGDIDRRVLAAADDIGG